MTLSKLDLVHQYYVEEWPVERIAGESRCTTPTIRNRRITYGMPDRDRAWTPDDDVRATIAMSKMTMGASLIGDMRTMASELQHRTGTVLQHCAEAWLNRYAPNVDVMPPGLGGFQIKRPLLRIQKLVPEAQVPKRQSAEAAGYDLHAIEPAIIRSGEQAIIGTGLAIAVPVGWVGKICPRSGLSANSGITIQNAPGVLDSDYRGEVKVILYNTGTIREQRGMVMEKKRYKVEVGDRIAQLVVEPCYLGDVIEVDNLDETQRGSGGFSSTGK